MVMKHPNLKLGKQMKRVRVSLGLGLREFANKAGVDHVMVWRLEKGMEVSLSSWAKLARAYRMAL